jgi:chemotaxis protein methyltransferase CheR
MSSDQRMTTQFDPMAPAAKLSPAVFVKVCDLLYKLSGIVLKEGKEELVQSRLSKRLKACGLGSFEAYMDLVASNKVELAQMVDVLTTNKTNFFREPAHFDLMRETLIPQWLSQNSEVRIWSAACSSGEEPYTIGMTMLEAAPALARKTKILATDLSAVVLEKARKATYANETVADVPAAIRSRYFEQVSAREQRVVPKVRDLVSFARLNLLDPFPMRGRFNLIFCRNVMIYFDKPTQLGLARRFREMLEPGGFLFIGHSESLGQSDNGLQYERPAVYTRC